MIRTCESVGFGHPDKIADRISDEVLTFLLSKDKNSKAGIETFISNQGVMVGGEYKSEHFIGANEIYDSVVNILKEMGHVSKVGEKVREEYGIDNGFEIQNFLKKQSPDISMGVELPDGEIGAGDQGIMFGYANIDTDALMPLPSVISNGIMREIQNKVLTDENTLLMPDGKCQVSIEYYDTTPMKVNTIIVSNQTKNNDRKTYEKEINDIINKCLSVVEDNFHSRNPFGDMKVLINPTGSFVVGGPKGDVGLTGRKIVADQYGSFSPVGGGALSGKDPSKVDRSGAYMARCLAVNLVNYWGLKDALVEVSYAIGVPDPISINISSKEMLNRNPEWGNYFRTLEKKVMESEIFRPSNIINRFDLLNFDYTLASVYGHYGRGFKWDESYSDIMDILKRR